jgi:hypothetical protein
VHACTPARPRGPCHWAQEIFRAPEAWFLDDALLKTTASYYMKAAFNDRYDQDTFLHARLPSSLPRVSIRLLPTAVACRMLPAPATSAHPQPRARMLRTPRTSPPPLPPGLPTPS